MVQEGCANGVPLTNNLLDVGEDLGPAIRCTVRASEPCAQHMEGQAGWEDETTCEALEYFLMRDVMDFRGAYYQDISFIDSIFFIFFYFF